MKGTDNGKSTLQGLRDRLAIEAGMLTRDEAHARGLCARCLQVPTYYSEAGKREFRISGLCESCYDIITGGE